MESEAPLMDDLIVKKKLQPYVENVPMSPVVNDDNDLVAAADLLKDVVTRRKDLHKLRTDITRPMDDAKKKVMDLFRPVEQALDTAEQSLKQAIGTYQDRKALAAAKLEADLRREHDEQAFDIETKALKLHAAGKHDQAHELMATVPTVPVVMPNKVNVPVSQRTTWKAQAPTTNAEMMDLLTYVIANDMWNLIMVNQTALDALARSVRGTMKVPGVKFYEQKTVVAR